MSTNYSVTRDQIIIAALRKIGAIEPADTAATIDPNLITNTAVNFNFLVKHLQTKGIKLWTVVEQVVPYTATKTTYTIGPSGGDITSDKPLRLIQAYLLNTLVTPNINTPLQILSKQEYNVLGSPSSTGVTNSVFLDVGTTLSTVYIYLTPDTFTATNYQLHLIVQRPIQDLNNSTDVPDFANEWYNTLLWLLADDIAIEYEVPANHRQEIMMKAKMYREELEEWDVENTSTFFQVDTRAQTYK